MGGNEVILGEWMAVGKHLSRAADLSYPKNKQKMHSALSNCPHYRKGYKKSTLLDFASFFNRRGKQFVRL
jgi:hypothetical protein